ncbi:hypothetical protein NQ024_13835, partial [Corynebacterium sp. 35RC1]|nr:hypothetical protein [Corynebacterium sp. 35RC1]
MCTYLNIARGEYSQMENYYKLEHKDVDGNKFLIVSESQMHISYMAEMIAHIEDVKSDKEIQF